MENRVTRIKVIEEPQSLMEKIVKTIHIFINIMSALEFDQYVFKFPIAFPKFDSNLEMISSNSVPAHAENV